MISLPCKAAVATRVGLVVLLACLSLPARAAAADAPPIAASADAGDNGDSVATLEQTGLSLVRQGKFAEADGVYSRLIARTLDNPAQALPYVFAKWHLRQEYEAQAALMQALRNGELSVANDELAKNLLDQAYDETAVMREIWREFPLPADREAAANLESRWLEACREIRHFETTNDRAGLRNLIGTLFGDGPAGVFHAIWRGYALIYRGGLDAAVPELNFALESNPDDQSQAAIVAGLRLIRDFRRSALSNELLDRISDVVSGVSTAMGEQFVDSYASARQKLETAERLIGERDYAAAAAELNEVRRMSLDEDQRAKYLFLLAESRWGEGAFARAYQGYVAAQALTRDRYARSAALFAMAEFSSREGRPDDAATFAARSAEALPEQSWKLRQVGGFFVGLGQPARGIGYFERALAASATLEDDAATYAELAEAYKRTGQRDQYLKAADDYVATVAELDAATPEQEGARFYYQGEVLAARGDLDGAYAAYESAAGLVTDRFRLAEILMNMAERRAALGDDGDAARLAARSAELLPDQDWKLRQAGDFLLRLGERERGFAYLEEALAQSRTPAGRAASYAALADASRSVGDDAGMLRYARDYVALEAADRDNLSPAEAGLAAFYRGEILLADDKSDQAFLEYERAAGLVVENYRLSDIYYRMAEIERRRGGREQAADYAERSAAALPDGWKLRQVGDFLLQLDMPDKAFDYFTRYARTGASPEDQASIYAAMADAYRNLGNTERFVDFAGRYIAATTADGHAPSTAERGLAAFYQAEIHALAGDAALANSSYEIAAPLLEDGGRQAQAYMYMAEYQAERGDKDRAAELAERSAAAFPDAWKQQQVGDFLMRLGMADRAFDYFERYARETASAEDKASVYATMADAYRDRGDTERYLHFAGEYVAAVTDAGTVPSPSEEGLMAFYRGELHRSRGENGPAYAEYERATGLLADAPKRSEALYQMAEILAGRGDGAGAADLAERSAAEIPDDWKQRQVGDFLLRLGLPERAAGYFERGAGPGGALAAYAAMADAYKDQGDEERYLGIAATYVNAVDGLDREPTTDEQALAAYYRGELLSARGDAGAALTAYGRAAELTRNAFLQSDAYMKMAEFSAAAKDRTAAAAYAEKAAAALPNADWKLRQVGELYDRLEMPEKAVLYFHRVVSVSESPKTRALANAALAEVYKKMNDPEKYLRHAGEYVAAVAAGEFVPSPEDEGLRYFYEGEIHDAANRPDQAYQAFERASRLVAEPYRLSDIYIRLARRQLKIGERDKAIDFAERARELLPDQGWRIMEVGDVYAGLGFTDKAIEYYRQAVALTPETGNRTAAYTALAEAYKKLGDQERYVEYARLYVAAMAERQGEISDNERALALFYRGESEAFAGDDASAYRSFEAAAALFTDTFRLSDIAMKQAEYHAKRDEPDQATAFAEKSAALIPDEAWRQKGTGDFFSNQDMMDKAIFYYERNLALSKTPETRAAAYAALADAYKKMDNKAMYVAMAREAVAAFSEPAGDLSRSENADYGYLQGEVRAADGDLAGAYQAYDFALRFIDEKYRRSDVLITMAKYNLEHGDRNLAAVQAIEAAGLLPDQAWRVQDAMGVLGDLGRYDDAYTLARTAVDLNPMENLQLYQALAQMHARAKDRKTARFFNAKYIDLLTEKAARRGRAPSVEEIKELWNARDWQNGMGRVWGLDSYLFGKRWPGNGNYFTGMSHELFRYYNLPNGMSGKMYAQFGGTLLARYSGHYLENSELRPWVSRPRLPDTSEFVVGINLNPFKGEFMSSVSVSAEQVFATGHDVRNDFRFRFGFDKTSGDKPRPVGKYWKYWKAYSNTIYSTRYNDFTSAGDYRLGVTIAAGRNGNWLFMPHVLATHSYGGKTVEKGARWGFDAGVGLAVRKWFREDKHNTPRSYIDLQVYYHQSLTHGRKSGPGFTLSTSF